MARGKGTKRGNCWLCGIEADLPYGHVMPNFVRRWMVEQAGDPTIRHASAFNKPRQDVRWREYMLCPGHEHEFSVWEGDFRNEVFLPCQDYEASPWPLKYGPSVLPCCVSISWRLARYKLQHRVKLRQMLGEYVDPALRAYEDVLLQRAEHPGPFRQYLIPVQAILQGPHRPADPMAVAYLQDAVDLDLLTWSGAPVCYAKMRGLILLAPLVEPRRGNFAGWDVRRSGGEVGGAMRYKLPHELLRHVGEAGESLHRTLGLLSDRQIESMRRKFEA